MRFKLLRGTHLSSFLYEGTASGDEKDSLRLQRRRERADVRKNTVHALWLLAGWEKITSPAWGTSGKAMSGFVAGALAKASGANPAVQGWYAWFLQHLVQPNLGLWSVLTTYGEFAVGLGVLLGVLTGIAAGFGVLMNLNYLLAGTVSINPVLGMFGLFLVFSWRVCGWIGGDRWFLPAIGLP